MRFVVASVQLLLLLVVEVTAVVVLVRLGDAEWAAVGWDDPLWWLAVVDAGDAVAAVGRWVALAGAVWLAASTVLAVAARLARVPAAVRAVDVLTLPPVRRLADRVVAVALTTTSLAAPAGAALAATTPHMATAAPAAAQDAGPAGPAGPRVQGVLGAQAEVAAAGDAQSTPLAAPVAWPGLPPLPAMPPSAAAPSEPPGAPAAAATAPSMAGAGPAAAAVHVVTAGDTLWDLSRARVAAKTDVEPGAVADRDVHAYWVRVLDANRDRIPSHDPDLIHPGDQVLLPPLP